MVERKTIYRLKDEFLTSASDASLRIWMVEANGRRSKDLIKCKSKQTGLKTVPTACTFSRDGLLVAAACQDGSLQVRLFKVYLHGPTRISEFVPHSMNLLCNKNRIDLFVCCACTASR
jgi:WD40 repeat protein